MRNINLPTKMFFKLFNIFIHNVRYYSENRYFVNRDFGYIYKLLRMLLRFMDNIDYDFERFVILSVDRFCRENKIPQRALGVALGAAPSSNPASKWQKVLKGDSKSEPQSLSLHEIFKIIRVIGKDPMEYLVYLHTVHKSSKYI